MTQRSLHIDVKQEATFTPDHHCYILNDIITIINDHRRLPGQIQKKGRVFTNQPHGLRSTDLKVHEYT